MDFLVTRWRAITAILIALLLSAGIGSTFAMWRASVSQPSSVILNGNLQLTGDSVSWVETNPGVPESSCRTGSDLTSLKDFIGAPGDEVEVRFRVASTLQGDNIQAVIRVRAAATPVLPAGVQIAGYRIRDSGGTVVAPAVATNVVPMGTTVQPAMLTSEGSRTFTVAAVIRWTGTTADVTYTSPLTAPESPTLADLPPITIGLEQSR